MNKGGINTAPSLGMKSGHSNGRFYWHQNEYPVGYEYIKKTSIDYPLGYDEAGEHAIEPTKKVGDTEVPDTKFNVFSSYQSYPKNDAVGGDIKQLNLSAEDCLKECDKNINCKGAVDHEESGLIIPQENSKALSDAICQILSNDELMAKYGKNSRLKAVNEFNEKIVVKEALESLGLIY